MGRAFTGICTCKSFWSEERTRQNGVPQQSSPPPPAMTLLLARRHVCLSGPSNQVLFHMHGRTLCLWSHSAHVPENRLWVTFDFLEMLIKEILTQLILGHRGETGVKPTTLVACPVSSLHWGLLAETITRGFSRRDTVCWVLTPSHIDQAGRDPGTISHTFITLWRLFV